MKPDPIFAAERVALARGGRVLAEDISFALAPGESLALTGPNGSGKSTALRVLAGLAPPLAGRVLYDGDPVENDPEVHGSRLVFIGHAHGLKADLTALENLDLWLALREPRLARPRRRNRILRVLREAGLDAVTDRMVSALSFGQARRVALCRLALADASAPLWLLDEPFAGLDSVASAHLAATIARHLAAGGIAIAATHRPLPFAATRVQALGQGSGQGLGTDGISAPEDRP